MPVSPIWANMIANSCCVQTYLCVVIVLSRKMFAQTYFWNFVCTKCCIQQLRKDVFFEIKFTCSAATLLLYVWIFLFWSRRCTDVYEEAVQNIALQHMYTTRFDMSTLQAHKAYQIFRVLILLVKKLHKNHYGWEKPSSCSLVYFNFTVVAGFPFALQCVALTDGKFTMPGNMHNTQVQLIWIITARNRIFICRSNPIHFQLICDEQACTMLICFDGKPQALLCTTFVNLEMTQQ